MFLHHFTAVLDDWDPRVIDPIAEQRHVITFDNRGIGGSGGKVPHTITVVDAIVRGIEHRAKRTVIPRQHGPTALFPGERRDWR